MQCAQDILLVEDSVEVDALVVGHHQRVKAAWGRFLALAADLELRDRPNVSWETGERGWQPPEFNQGSLRTGEVASPEHVLLLLLRRHWSSCLADRPRIEELRGARKDAEAKKTPSCPTVS